jgi:hypothetical protein
LGTLTINFQGICTWFAAEALREGGIRNIPSDVRWRVVLPHTPFGFSYFGPNLTTGPSIVQPVPPHEADMNLFTNEGLGNLSAISATSGKLTGMLPGSATVWKLRGVRVSVANATSGQEMTPEPSATSDALPNVPSLSAQVTLQPPPLLEFAADVVAGSSASAIFDIVSGKLTTRTFPSANQDIKWVQYVVQTDGPPRINVETFFDNSMATLTFQSDNSAVTIENVGKDMDTWWDWVIHYLCFTAIPPGIIPPGLPTIPIVDGLTAGCSNSQWP